jgi:membrane protein YqaA with SNARE-associated domain
MVGLENPIAALIFKSKLMGTLAHRFGAFLFFPLGFLDNSPIPMPGSMDALLIFLAASKKELWWYYALMATAGAVISSWPMYRLGSKGGEKALDEKLGESRAKKIRTVFEKYGFWSIFFGAIAPPPVPCSAFIATAGAMEYSTGRFLAALTSGRLLRFGLVGWVASRYGRHIFQFLTKYYKPAMFALLALAVVGGIFAIRYWRRARGRKKSEDAGARVPQRDVA